MIVLNGLRKTMKPKKILILVNHEVVIYNFRKELVQRLLSEVHQVYISSPEGPKTELLKDMGAMIIPLDIKRHSKNPFHDIKLFIYYLKNLKRLKPDVVLTYTIKPNIYGGLASRIKKIPYIVTITGLGQSMNQGLKSILPETLYKQALKKATHVFFQNEENLKYMKHKKIIKTDYSLINGSGVNLKDFKYHPYPESRRINFLFVGRIMKDKGIEEFLSAAKVVKEKYNNMHFDIVGSMEEDYSAIINQFEKDGIIAYHGYKENTLTFYQNTHVLVLTSYHEGLSNVLLEASAVGRPSIGSNISGIKEIIEDRKTGYLIKPRCISDLIATMFHIIKFDHSNLEFMGQEASIKVKENFDREKIVGKYIKLLKDINNDHYN